MTFLLGRPAVTLPASERQGAILRGKANRCKVYGRSAVSCAKTDQPIEMPFGLRIRVGSRNNVSNEVHIAP